MNELKAGHNVHNYHDKCTYTYTYIMKTTTERNLSLIRLPLFNVEHESRNLIHQLLIT